MAKSKLHQLLAVEGDLGGIAGKVTLETRTNFTKHPDRYMGHRTSVEPFDEGAAKEADDIKALDDTVKAKLDYTAEHLSRYLDCVLQKEATNQVACADLVVDGVTIATNLPATFLLGLEKKLKNIRDSIYQAIPTLQPGVHWELDPSQGENVYKRVHPEERFRTKRVRKNHVLAEATKEHPAQVEMFTEDVNVARVVKNVWSGMISVAEKSALLGRVEKLLRGVKKARQIANNTQVVKVTVGKELFDYINANSV